MNTILSTWKEPGAVAIEAAKKSQLSGASLLEILVDGLAECELDPGLLLIGLGGLPNAQGVVELDASVMVGANLDCGAVAAVQDIVPVIRLAKLVMEQTPHVMLAGNNAREFALSHGFQTRSLLTPTNVARYQEWLSHNLPPAVSLSGYEHARENASVHEGDTVTMVGVENHKCVAASSTSGISYKVPGRVGDSPIIGAGIYADDEAGAAGATGLGEELWKAVASFRVVEAMRNGMHPKEACESVIRNMLRRQPESSKRGCAVLAVDLEGNHGAAITCETFDYWVLQNGETSMFSVGATI